MSSTETNSKSQKLFALQKLINGDVPRTLRYSRLTNGLMCQCSQSLHNLKDGLKKVENCMHL